MGGEINKSILLSTFAGSAPQAAPSAPTDNGPVSGTNIGKIAPTAHLNSDSAVSLLEDSASGETPETKAPNPTTMFTATWDESKPPCINGVIPLQRATEETFELDKLSVGTDSPEAEHLHEAFGAVKPPELIDKTVTNSNIDL